MEDEKNDLRKQVEESLYFVFKIKYNGTEENKQTHEDFKTFCVTHTDNSYILGIRKLLENSTTDWKYEALYAELQGVKEMIAKITEEPVVEKEEGGVATFGRKE